jgi:uncharacterized protein YcbK (DUF882 family)
MRHKTRFRDQIKVNILKVGGLGWYSQPSSGIKNMHFDVGGTRMAYPAKSRDQKVGT